MSDEKIDLAEIETITRQWFGRDAHPVLALVAAVRAAIVVAADPLSTDAVRRLDEALAPFTDSSDSAGDKT